VTAAYGSAALRPCAIDAAANTNTRSNNSGKGDAQREGHKVGKRREGNSQRDAEWLVFRRPRDQNKHQKQENFIGNS
jgi:hypothetical protein